MTQLRVPSYRKHKPSGQAVVTLSGSDVYLGKWNTASSRSEYDRLIAEWIAGGRAVAPGNRRGETIAELILAYWKHAEGHYRHTDGTPTSEVKNIKYPLRTLKHLFGRTQADEFGPLRLKAVRQSMIEAGHCRNLINKDIDRIKRMFRWGVENEVVSPSVYHGLQAVSGLRRGRSDAKESEPVKPVPEAFVDAVLPFVRPPVRAMIELQRLTGMRSGEIVIMRGCDLDTTGKLWVYRPGSHKTEHHGHEKVIYLGPRAQEILEPWLKTDLQAYLFSPRESKEAWYVEKRLARKSKVTPFQAGRQRKRNPKRTPREHYTSDGYHHAVEQGIIKANELSEDESKKTPHWHPHQLRHNAATRLRKEFGLEAARVVLGHRSAAVTEVYAEIDHAKAADIMLKVG